MIIDGLDVRRIKQRSLRHHIGVVLQDNVLFSDSVCDHIAIRRPARTRSWSLAAGTTRRSSSARRAGGSSTRRERQKLHVQRWTWQKARASRLGRRACFQRTSGVSLIVLCMYVSSVSSM